MTEDCLVDTNILVYAYDECYPTKMAKAEALLRNGIKTGHVKLAHQAIVEFVASSSRVDRATQRSILPLHVARQEAEGLLSTFDVLFPDDDVLRTALRGAAAFNLSWYDAHMWAYAEVYAISTLLSEDFQHGQLIGNVRIRNPFID